jgi:putative tricarboxylic transport membrane protein
MTEPVAPLPRWRVSARVLEIVFGVALVLFSLIFLWHATEIRQPFTTMVIGPRVFPYIVGALMLGVTSLLLWRRIRDRDAGIRRDEDGVPLEEDDDTSISDWPGVWLTLGSLVALFALLEPLGFIPAMTLFLFVVSTFFSPGRWLRNLIVALIFSGSFFFLFAWFLGIPLPKGILAPLLTNMVG